MATNRPTDIEEVFREVSPTLWRALYAYSGGRREIADDAVAEAFARPSGASPPGTVVVQDPAAGAEVAPGTTVDVKVALSK